MLVELVERASTKSRLIAGFISAILTFDLVRFATLLTPSALQDYGLSLFVLAPFLLGVFASLIVSWKQERFLRDSLLAATYGILCGCFGLICVQMEGAVCILMASPLIFGLGLLGASAGHALQRTRWSWRRRHGLFAALAVVAPFAMVADRIHQPLIETRMVSSDFVIDAPPEKVWPFICSLADMPDPDFWLFKAGIAYPVGVKTEGLVRHCILSTGDMPERITAFEPGRLLRFEVISTPSCMRETNPFGEVHAAHLLGHFECERGEFRLEPLPGGKTRLVGTSWYHHRFAPSVYWSLWTDSIVRQVQQRVFREVGRRFAAP